MRPSTIHTIGKEGTKLDEGPLEAPRKGPRDAVEVERGRGVVRRLSKITAVGEGDVLVILPAMAGGGR